MGTFSWSSDTSANLRWLFTFRLLISAPMSDPASAMTSPSKTQVFLRSLASTVVLWTAILAAMFSGNRFIADGVFVFVVAFLALAGLVEFYGLAEKRGLACFKITGVIGGGLR